MCVLKCQILYDANTAMTVHNINLTLYKALYNLRCPLNTIKNNKNIKITLRN